MTQQPDSLIRRAGILGATGGVLTAATGLLVTAVVLPTSDVPEDTWSSPWESTPFVPVSVLYAVFHLLVLAGVVGLLRSGVAGSGRAPRVGGGLATAGLVLFAVAELASIPVRDQTLDDTGPTVAGAVFGIATLVTAAGMIVLGVPVARAGSWQGWRRLVPLATGIWLLVVAALATTKALAAGVTIYGLLAAALGIALITQPRPQPPAPAFAASTIRV